jgi:thiopeptide-type bacteriocin biosynthesis protein
MVRTPLLPIENDLPVFVGGSVNDADDLELTSYLRAAAAHPVLREAIAISAPSLADLLDRAVHDVPVRRPQLRKAALSVARYIIRAGNRSTPFGILAGVAPLSFDSQASISSGPGHTKHVRLDALWLVEILQALEQRNEVLTELHLVLNHEAVRKGGGVEFYASVLQDKAVKWAPPVRKSVRAQLIVNEVLRLAARPIHGRTLLDQLGVTFPNQSTSRLTSLLGQLIRCRMLLTSLQPSLSTADPLGHLLNQLDTMPEEARSAVRADLGHLRDGLIAYEATAVGAGYDALEQARRVAHRVSGRRTPFAQVDLRLAEHVELPRSVAEEAAGAVDVLWRISPRQGRLERGLRHYRDQFEDIYGRDALLPLNILLDPERGLGHPPTWARSAELDGNAEPVDDMDAEVRDEERRRTLALAELAWPAGPDMREIELSDEMVNRLSRTTQSTPRPTSEVMFELIAGSVADIEYGDYRLVLRGGSQQAAALFGRFASLLPELDGSLRQVLVHGTGTVGLPAQMMNHAVPALAYAVGNAPQWTDRTVPVGEVRLGAESGRGTGQQVDHDVTDILIGLRGDGFRAVSAATGDELRIFQANVQNVDDSGTPAVRFLRQISDGRGKPWRPWSWGEFDAAPHLPRIRYGRSILSLERWRASSDMADAGGDWKRWGRAFYAWRERYRVPDEVEVSHADQRLVLDLKSPLHQQLLYEELRKSPGARIHEATARIESGGGWLKGRATEVVVPLLAVPSEEESAASASAATRAPAMAVAAMPVKTYPVGGEWLYAKIYSSARLHDEVLGEWMPELLDAVEGHVDRWFFMRYRDYGDHLRLRLNGAPDELVNHVLPRLSDWGSRLHDAGLAREWSLHAYQPETARYGGPEGMANVESAFQADSEVAIAQLRLLRADKLGVHKEVVLALNLVDIARAIKPESWADWLVEQVPRDLHRERYRARRGELRALTGLSPQDIAQRCGGVELAAAWQSRAEALAAYRDELAHGDGDEAHEEARSRRLKSLMHMHHNRVRGIAPESEAAAHAMARGFAELTIGAATFGQSRG